MENQDTAAVNRRQAKNFLLDPSAQFKIALWIFANGFVFAALLYGALIFLLSSMLTNMVTLAPGSAWATGPEIENLKQQIWISFSLFAIASLLGSILVAIKISHRYLGPMQSMRRYLRSLVDGSVSGPLTLREGDQTQLVPEINDLARKMYPEKFN